MHFVSDARLPVKIADICLFGFILCHSATFLTKLWSISSNFRSYFFPVTGRNAKARLSKMFFNSHGAKYRPCRFVTIFFKA